jgi:hypothetical protein
MRFRCECGYEGSVRVIEGLAKCFGCDKLLIQKGEKMEAVKEVPKFNSFEEMQKFLDKAQGAKVSKKSVAKKSSKKKPVRPDSANKLAARDVDDKTIYQTIHFYVRAGDNFPQILKDAKQDKSSRMSNVLVFAHDHIFGVSCTTTCREV